MEDSPDVSTFKVPFRKKRPTNPAVKKSKHSAAPPGKTSKSEVPASKRGRKKKSLESHMDVPAQEPVSLKDKDPFCWTCHKGGGGVVACSLCPRCFHQSCSGSRKDVGRDWVCPRCRTQETTADLLPQHPSLYLRHILERINKNDSELVDVLALLKPEDVVCHVDLGMLQEKIRDRTYQSLDAFISDVKWIQHNAQVYYSESQLMVSAAKAVVKICQEEVAEIEVCPRCYTNTHTLASDWFSEPCGNVHSLVWAKLKGFPYWPAKVMRIQGDQVNVRFFGGHERGLMPISKCYFLSEKPPSAMKGKTKYSFDSAMQELGRYLEKIRQRGSFYHFPPQTLFDPALVHKQFQLFPGEDLMPSFNMQAAANPLGESATQASSEEGPMMENGEAKETGSLRVLSQDFTPEVDSSSMDLPESSTTSEQPLHFEDSTTSSFDNDLEGAPQDVPGSQADHLEEGAASETGDKEEDEMKAGKLKAQLPVSSPSSNPASSEKEEVPKVKLKAVRTKHVSGKLWQVNTAYEEEKSKAPLENHKTKKGKSAAEDAPSSDTRGHQSCGEPDQGDSSVPRSINHLALSPELKTPLVKVDSATLDKPSPSLEDVSKKPGMEEPAMAEQLAIAEPATLPLAPASEASAENSCLCDDVPLSGEAPEKEELLSKPESPYDVDVSLMQAACPEPQPNHAEKGAEKLLPVTASAQLNGQILGSYGHLARELGSLLKLREKYLFRLNHEDYTRKRYISKLIHRSIHLLRWKEKEILKRKFSQLETAEKFLKKLKQEPPDAQKSADSKKSYNRDLLNKKTHKKPSSKSDQPSLEVKSKVDVNNSPEVVPPAKSGAAAKAEAKAPKERLLSKTSTLNKIPASLHSQLSITVVDNSSDKHSTADELSQNSLNADAPNGSVALERLSTTTLSITPSGSNSEERDSKDCQSFQEKLSSILFPGTETEPPKSNKERGITSPSCEVTSTTPSTETTSDAAISITPVLKVGDSAGKGTEPPSKKEHSSKDKKSSSKAPSSESSKAISKEDLPRDLVATAVPQDKPAAPQTSPDGSWAQGCDQLQIIRLPATGDTTPAAGPTLEQLEGKSREGRSNQKNGLPPIPKPSTSVPAPPSPTRLPKVKPGLVNGFSSRTTTTNNHHHHNKRSSGHEENPQPHKMPRINYEAYLERPMAAIRDTLKEFYRSVFLEGQPIVSHFLREMDKLKVAHREELREIKQNTDLIMLEMKASMEEDKQRCLSEAVRRAVEETKKKQWCAQCGKEAIFYCCWNTSYCDYPCQQAHWPSHMSSCAQHQAAASRSAAGPPTPQPSPRRSQEIQAPSNVPPPAGPSSKEYLMSPPEEDVQVVLHTRPENPPPPRSSSPYQFPHMQYYPPPTSMPQVMSSHFQFMSASRPPPYLTMANHGPPFPQSPRLMAAHSQNLRGSPRMMLPSPYRSSFF